MSFFTSRREKRLWLRVLAVVVAIYSTLGVAPRLVGVLADRELIDATFVMGALLVLATIVTHGLRSRPRGLEIAFALGVAAAYVMVVVRLSIPAVERTHLIEYGVVALFMFEALAERARQGRRAPAPAIIAIVATALIGVLDETIQWLLPSRVFDPRDILFNSLAAAMAVTASVALDWARARSR